MQGTDGGLWHPGHGTRARQNRQDVGFTVAGKGVDGVDGDVADLARGHRDDARKRKSVARVETKAQIRDQVLDLAPLPEAHATHKSIRDTAARQHILECAGLRVGPVQHREVGVAPLLGLAQALDLVRDELGLLHLVVGLSRDHLLATRAIGPQPFLGALGVVADDAVRRVEDGLARSVVLLEMHDVRVWIVLLEIEDVADVRTAKAIDRLIVVADHRDVAVLRGEEVNEHVLGPVRVLVLVDQYVAEPVAPLLERLGVGAVELDELHDQVVEIEPA